MEPLPAGIGHEVPPVNNLGEVVWEYIFRGIVSTLLTRVTQTSYIHA